MGISHILSLGPHKFPRFVLRPFARHFTYRLQPFPDHPDVNLLQLLPSCLSFIQDALAHSSNKVLVCCTAGNSRSVAICCAYLMQKEGKTYREALSIVRKARPHGHPNEGFSQHLCRFETKLQKQASSAARGGVPTQRRPKPRGASELNPLLRDTTREGAAGRPSTGAAASSMHTTTTRSRQPPSQLAQHMQRKAFPSSSSSSSSSAYHS
eukprot:GHVT01053243.1.p1 GENE.GHVT01053243.1~~GHVT01053243.1.p1  ORF type:complete len:210 (-),score=33.43 GHVT01053243.1:649-1278(-)